jgi:ligand-binding sensor domain-containing protein
MKTTILTRLCVSLLTLFAWNARSQAPKWVNFTSISSINAVVEEGPYIWAATDGGLVRIEKSSYQPHYFNREGKGPLMAEMNCITVDKSGTKWIGTKSLGLVSFDNVNVGVKNVYLDSSFHFGSILAVHVDKNDTKWFSSQWFLGKLDATGKLTRYQLPIEVNIQCMATDTLGVLWLGTGQGLFKFDGTFTKIYKDNLMTDYTNVSSLVFSKSGAMYIGVTDGNHKNGGLLKVENNTWTNYDFSEKSVNTMQMGANGWLTITSGSSFSTFDGQTFHTTPTDYGFGSALTDQTGNTWVASTKLLVFPSSGNSFEVPLSNSPLFGNQVKNIQFEKGKTAWVTSGGKAMVGGGLQGIKNGIWDTYYGGNSKSIGAIISSLLVDSKGNKWLGTESSTLLKFDNSFFKTFPIVPYSSSQEVVHLKEDSLGRIWGSTGFLFRFDGSTWKYYVNSNEVPAGGTIFGMDLDSKGNVWAGTDRGLYEYNGSSWTLFGSYVPHYNIVVVDKADNKWMEAAPLRKYDGNTFQDFHFEDPSFPLSAVEVDEQEHIWIGQIGGYFKYFDGNKWIYFDPRNSGMASDMINCISKDAKGNIWMGTQQGILLYNENGVDSSDYLPHRSIGFLLPKAGDTLTGCTTYTVTLDQAGKENFQAWFSSDGGKSWNFAQKFTGTTFSWTSPAINSFQCRFKIIGETSHDTIYSHVFGMLSTLGRSISLNSPKAGDSVLTGHKVSLSWTSTGTVQTVNLSYSIDGGIAWNTIANNVSNTGTYLWTAPSLPSSQCRIKVSDGGNSCVYDLTKGVFAIVSAPYIQLTYPNLGEKLAVGTTRTITWQSNVTSNQVILSYSVDSGAVWKTIGTTSVEQGKLNWKVPNEISSICLIKIVSLSNPSLSDVTDQVFSIRISTLQFTSPNEGSSVTACSPIPLTWKAQGVSGIAVFSYSFGSGKRWMSLGLTSQITGDNQYAVSLDGGVTSDILLRINDYADTSVQDTLALKLINNSSFTLNSPNGGETFVAGNSYSIQWTKKDGEANVILSYTSNDGLSWNTIATVPNNGSYLWKVPEFVSSSVRIRVAASTNLCNQDQSDGNLSVIGVLNSFDLPTEEKIRSPFPNPCHGTFFVPSLGERKEIEMTDLYGEKINFQVSYEEEGLKVEVKEARGIYFLIEKGSETSVRKIIVQ